MSFLGTGGASEAAAADFSGGTPSSASMHAEAETARADALRARQEATSVERAAEATREQGTTVGRRVCSTSRARTMRVDPSPGWWCAFCVFQIVSVATL